MHTSFPVFFSVFACLHWLCWADDCLQARVQRIDPSQFMLPRNDSYQYNTSSQMGSHEVQSLPRSPENVEPNGVRLHDAYTSSTAPLYSQSVQLPCCVVFRCWYFFTNWPMELSDSKDTCCDLILLDLRCIRIQMYKHGSKSLLLCWSDPAGIYAESLWTKTDSSCICYSLW